MDSRPKQIWVFSASCFGERKNDKIHDNIHSHVAYDMDNHGTMRWWLLSQLRGRSRISKCCTLAVNLLYLAMWHDEPNWSKFNFGVQGCQRFCRSTSQPFHVISCGCPGVHQPFPAKGCQVHEPFMLCCTQMFHTTNSRRSNDSFYQENPPVIQGEVTRDFLGKIFTLQVVC